MKKYDETLEDGFFIDGKPMEYCCDEECLAKHVKGKIDEQSHQRILREENKRD